MKKTFNTTRAAPENVSSLVSSTAAAKVLGVTVSTVKRWADDGGLFHVRTAGGHRRFRMSDVQSMKSQSQPAVEQWLRLLLSDRSSHAVQGALYTLRDSCGTWSNTVPVLAAVLQEVGQQWSVGTLSVYQEHLASERLGRALAACSDSIPSSQNAPICLLATPEDEEHTLGLSLLEPCLRELGWRTSWVGRKTHTPEIVSCVQAGDLSVVVLSASICQDNKEALIDMAENVGDVCKQTLTGLWLGGMGAWPDTPNYGLRMTSFEQVLGPAYRSGDSPAIPPS